MPACRGRRSGRQARLVIIVSHRHDARRLEIMSAESLSSYAAARQCRVFLAWATFR